MDFTKALEKTSMSPEFNGSVTENGAIGYKSTGKPLVDLNFKLSSLRSASDDDIIKEWEKAFMDNRELSMRWLFYTRDVRAGLGERRIFRVIMKHLAMTSPDYIAGLLTTHNTQTDKIGEVIPYFGRWDDLLVFMDTPLESHAISLIARQINADISNAQLGRPISLCAKWLPTIKFHKNKFKESSKPSKKEIAKGIAKRIARRVGQSDKQYRQTLSYLRWYMKVTERLMSDNKWDEIDYEAVPSLANLRYLGAFLKHDEQRRTEYLTKLRSGEAKINSSVCFPHDIVMKYDNSTEPDTTLEAMWNSLPNTITDPNARIMAVCDTSYSMNRLVDFRRSMLSAYHVATSLSIYFAERLRGEFHNKIILFSSNPVYIDLDNCDDTLLSKIRYVKSKSDCSSTNIERTMRLILKTAVDNNLTQSDLPSTILIFSDMEFNVGTEGINQSLMDKVAEEFSDHGYQLPHIEYWNICSRSMTIPMINNQLGVTLVSGFSPNTAKLILSGILDPYEALLHAIMDHRYDIISNFLNAYQPMYRTSEKCKTCKQCIFE